MKRTTIILSLIFALAIALSVSVPTMAAESGSTTISGALAQHIDVTAPSNIVNLVLEPGATATDTSDTPGNVKANKGNWYLYIEGDHDSMYSTNLGDGLDEPFKVDVTVTDVGTTGLVNIGTDPFLTSASKTGGTGKAIALGISQAVTWDDEAADDYEIEITFTGSYTAP